jgi:murein DD-endopeptidase MepM/ murein hydrolase activator NlpD
MMPARRLIVLVALAASACQAPLVPMATLPVPAAPPESLEVRKLTAPAAERVVAAKTAVPVASASRDWPGLTYLRSRQLMVPVQGATVFDIADTFDDARDGGERVHRAVDIRAARGTPILAADAGKIIALKSNRLGGITVYAVDPESRIVYYYAHLDRYADGLAEGQMIEKGTLLGYVGTTGNAPPNVPHLHFQVMRLADPKHYWDGPVLDPRPYFTWDAPMAVAMQRGHGR